jgi:plastocyanin
MLVPVTAHAAVTRAIQSVSLPTRLYWSPSQLNAQQGDTIQWRMTEPGNPNAATHDVWLIKPGADPSTAQQLGATYLNNGLAAATVDQVGTYTFYCNIHGGLAPGGMNGTITVGTTDPGPPVDPGQPWTNPDDGGGYPGDGGPPPWLNPTTAPTVFETGDNTPPRLTLISVDTVKRTSRLVIDVSEGSKIAVTVKRKKLVVSTKVVKVAGGRATILVDLPKKKGTYTIKLQAIDGVDLESNIVTTTVRVKKGS